MIEDLYTLLRLGLGTENADSSEIVRIRSMSMDEFLALFDLAEEQCVLAIAFDGLLNSSGVSDSPCALEYPENKAVMRSLFAKQFNYEKTNREQIMVLNKISHSWSAAGCRGVLMKGQANSLLYPVPGHRACGDIDVYMLDDNYELGNTVAAESGARVSTHWYKHSQIHYCGQMIENHRYFVHTRDGKRGKELDRRLRELVSSDTYSFYPDTEICLPPAQFNALFLTYHAFAHFISEGIKLKQILDWAMFLKSEYHNVDWNAFYADCDRFHLRRFADVMNDIAVNIFGVSIPDGTVCTVSPYTAKVLDSALHDKDYVFSSGKSGLANRLHLVGNMFKYRWKYRDIYQDSVLKQLYYYVSGYLFHTE